MLILSFGDLFGNHSGRLMATHTVNIEFYLQSESLIESL